MTAAKLDLEVCRTIAEMIIQALGLGCEVLHISRQHCTSIAIQLTAAADLAERPALTEQRVREVVARAAADVLGEDHAFGGDPLRIAARAAKELAGATVDLAQRGADLREAVLYGARWQDPLRTAESPELLQAAAEYARRKAGGSQLHPVHTVGIGPADTAIIDRALACLASRETLPGHSLRADIDRIRALLSSPGGGS